MAAPALVAADLEKGRATVEAITKARIPVERTIWAHFSQADEWRFMIVTPLVDREGPRAAYVSVQRAIRGTDALPLDRLVVVGTDELLGKLVANSLKRRPRARGELAVTAATAATTGIVDSLYADSNQRP